VPYLFDTDAISEVLRPRPLPAYVEWLARIPREEQFTSAVALGELFYGAYRAVHTRVHLENIRARVLPTLTVLPFDESIAEVSGALAARLERTGRVLPDADVQIAATALYHGLELVTGNIRHFERIEELQINRILEQSRRPG
jgi:predicted nucleic acid-binding protein